MVLGFRAEIGNIKADISNMLNYLCVFCFIGTCPVGGWVLREENQELMAISV